MIEDITTRKDAEELRLHDSEKLESQVAERTVQLKASNKELESFAYCVSHDLRSPLRAIEGCSRILMEDFGTTIEGLEAQYFERICAATVRMGELIDDLLLISRISRDPMRREPVDLSEEAKAIIAELREADPNRPVKVIVGDSLNVVGDPWQIRTLLQNILGNAWKFTKKNEQAEIEFGAMEKDSAPIFFVRDNGVGLDMAYANKLFKPFQRLHAIHEFSGSGIGLASAQRVILRHGGRIWVESELGVGTTFYFTLM